MKNNIRLGDIHEGEELTLDVEALVDTRMVIEANSGGGKSYFMRLLAERTAASIPAIVLDYEGEFSTLREKRDLVLVGTEGEIAADVRSAKLLARKLIETEVSAVIDLYELRTHERQEYTRIFLDALINLPRSLWKPYLIFIDEAHKLCPERGDAKATSTQAVIDLMSLGGKRGFCGILATQRFSKLHNNALAEANNFLIGRTVLDADQKRAGDYLGMTSAQRTQLRDVERGHFYAFGPALSYPGVAYFLGDKAETTHLRGAQRRKMQPPKPSHAIQKILSQFADLPQQAEEEARTLEEAQRQIAEMKREVKRLEKAQPEPPKAETVTVEVPVITDEQIAHIEEVVAEMGGLREVADGLKLQLEELKNFETSMIEGVRRLKGASVAIVVASPPTEKPRGAPHPTVPPPPADTDGKAGPEVGQRILDTLRSFESLGLKSVERRTLAAFVGYAATTKSFTYGLSSLKQDGLIQNAGASHVALTADGRARAAEPEALPTRAALHEAWMSRLDEPQQIMTRALIRAYPGTVSREELARLCGLALTTKSFTYGVSAMQTLGLMRKAGKGEFVATEILFPPGLS